MEKERCLRCAGDPGCSGISADDTEPSGQARREVSGAPGAAWLEAAHNSSSFNQAASSRSRLP